MKATISMMSVAMLALAACSPKAEQSMETAANSTGNALEAAGAMASNAVDATVDAVTPTPSTQNFVDKAAKSDGFEIAAAKLAAIHADAQPVKDFAAQMIKAHTESAAKIKAAAEASMPALTPDTRLTADQTKKLADLSKLNGAAFDKAYIAGQVEAHEDALSLMQNYARNGTTEPLKKAASEIAPTVQKHLDMAKALKSAT